ncbi:hypothetical protein [Arthrobacter sp. B2a2-09]|nr:hypothetical protein [Arthrobacter sp. B2a2-09]
MEITTRLPELVHAALLLCRDGKLSLDDDISKQNEGHLNYA